MNKIYLLLAVAIIIVGGFLYFKNPALLPGLNPFPQAQQETVAAINQRIFNNGIYITPLAVVSDSRCPAKVMCFWAGEITIKVKLEKGTVSKEVNLGETQNVIFEDNQVTFESASPDKKSNVGTNDRSIPTNDYRFTFKVVPINVSTGTGTIEGKVTLSPTCPVERMPPDPACAPKPYATSISAIQNGTGKIIKIFTSNSSGVFSINLDLGSYTLQAGGGKVLPRCSDVSVEVKRGETVTADISCDTGIR